MSSGPSSGTPGAVEPPVHIHDHERLCPIGQGSYGEVWLARNAVGTLRAVKIVHRQSFEQVEHFEREFKGLQKFEPISRSHDGVVDILQIGRDDAAGYFYYVMELADAAEPRVPSSEFRVSSSTNSVPGSEFRVPSSTDSVPSQPETRNPELETYVGGQPETRNPKLGTCLRAGGQLGTRNSEHETYSPKTLRAAQQRDGRLPVDECLQVALALASALQHLHKNGLVHRDIKPSNIIFVNGAPKLADIGLVAHIDDARSLVGTAGYIPPEGPGSARADLYSLGKVLYEISLGKDRQDFPQLPPDLQSHPDHAALLELNEVILKACETDFRKRYQTAQQMHDDLALLQRGESLKRQRSVQRRFAFAKKIGLAAAVVAGVVTSASLLSSRFNDSTIQRFNAPAPVEVDSLAVLPFVNESKFPEHEYLSDALADEAMQAFTNIAGLRVASRQSAFAFKGTNADPRHAGEQLGVRTVLAGTFLRSSNGMHVTARLLKVGDGAQRWSATFDHEREKLGELGTDLIQSASRALGLALEDAVLDRARTNLMRKLAAYKLYSQASTNVRNTQDGLDRGIRLLSQAIAEDSTYAQAYADLAYCYNEASGFYLQQAQAMDQSKVNALRALQLDDSLPVAHRALAFVQSRHHLDLAQARVHFRRAIELAPKDGASYGDYAWALSHFGFFDEAQEVLKSGEQVNPNSHNLLGGWCWRYYLARDFENARQAANRLQTAYPNSIMGIWFLELAHEGLGQYDEALALAQRMMDMDPGPEDISRLGRVQARLGHREEAQKALEELRVLSRTPRGTVRLAAEVLLALRDYEHAIEHLQRAVDDYPPTVLLLKAHPMWDDLRSDPRFQALLKKGGLEK